MEDEAGLQGVVGQAVVLLDDEAHERRVVDAGKVPEEIELAVQLDQRRLPRLRLGTGGGAGGGGASVCGKCVRVCVRVRVSKCLENQ